MSVTERSFFHVKKRLISSYEKKDFIKKILISTKKTLFYGTNRLISVINLYVLEDNDACQLQKGVRSMEQEDSFWK